MLGDSPERRPPNLSRYGSEVLKELTNLVDNAVPVDYVTSTPLERHADLAAFAEVVRWARYVLRNYADEE